MRASALYKKLKINIALHVSVRALVPAYLDALNQLFFVFPDMKQTFFDKKNTSLGLLC